MRSIFILLVFSFNLHAYTLTPSPLVDSAKVVELKTLKIIRKLEAQKKYPQAQMVADRLKEFIEDKQAETQDRVDEIELKMEELIDEFGSDLSDDEALAKKNELRDQRRLLKKYEHWIDVIKKEMMLQREDINKQIAQHRLTLQYIIKEAEKEMSSDANTITQRLEQIEFTKKEAQKTIKEIESYIKLKEEDIKATFQGAKDHILAEREQILNREQDIKLSYEEGQKQISDHSNQITVFQDSIEGLKEEARKRIEYLNTEISNSTNQSNILLMKEEIARIYQQLADKTYSAYWNTSIGDYEASIANTRDVITRITRELADGTFKTWWLESINTLKEKLAQRHENIENVNRQLKDGTYKLWYLVDLNSLRADIGAFQTNILNIKNGLKDGTYKLWNLPSINDLNQSIQTAKDNIQRIKKLVTERLYKTWNSKEMRYYDQEIDRLRELLNSLALDFNNGTWARLGNYPVKVKEIKERIAQLELEMGMVKEYQDLGKELEELKRYKIYVPNIQVMRPDLEVPMWIKAWNFLDKAYTTTEEFLKFKQILSTAKKMNPWNGVDYLLRYIPGLEGKGLFERIGKVVFPKKWMKNEHIMNFWKDLDSKKLFQGLVQDSIPVTKTMAKTIEALDSLKNKSYDEFLKIAQGAQEVEQALREIPMVKKILDAQKKIKELEANFDSAFDNILDQTFEQVDTAVDRTLKTIDPILDETTNAIIDGIFSGTKYKSVYSTTHRLGVSDLRLEKSLAIMQNRFVDPDNYQRNLDRALLFYMKDTVEMEYGLNDHLIDVKFRDAFIQLYEFQP